MPNIVFGRRVRVTIYVADDAPQSAYVFENNLIEGKRGFRITGKVSKYFAIQPPEATVDIYNLSPIEMANIMSARYVKNGNQFSERELRIKIEAGYNNSLFGTIFDGQILKPNMVRPDANNTILRLTCIDGSNFIAAGSSLTQTFNDGMNFYAVAQQIHDNSDVDYSLVLSDSLKNIRVDGSFVSSNGDYSSLRNIAEETDCVFSYRNGTAYIQTLREMLESEQDAFVLNSNTGLIGIPMLNDDGVSIQSVLNPNYDILKIVQINNAEISINQPEYLNNRELGAWLSSDGLYRIIELTHNFDTTTGAFTSDMRCLARDYYNILEDYEESINNES